MKNLMTRRTLVAALMIGALAPTAAPVSAHEADCPVCQMPVVQDTAKQDNEVKVRYGRKRLEYRCVFCALSDAQNELKKGDITIAAPSETKDKPVILKRTDGKWDAPDGAVFAARKASHRVCQITYRAFHSRAGFAAWVKAHPDQFDKDEAPLSFAQILKSAQ